MTEIAFSPFAFLAFRPVFLFTRERVIRSFLGENRVQRVDDAMVRLWADLDASPQRLDASSGLNLQSSTNRLHWHGQEQAGAVAYEHHRAPPERMRVLIYCGP